MLAAPAPRAVLLALLTLTGACSLIPRARSEPTRFYTLSLPVPPHPSSGAPLRLGVGPIVFPSYLDQSQLVHRLADERVAYAPADRWAGPLRGQFERALVLRLMAELDTDDITTFPWWPRRPVDAAVKITLLSFETDASGMARLDALWKVTPGNECDSHGPRNIADSALGNRSPSASCTCHCKGRSQTAPGTLQAVRVLTDRITPRTAPSWKR